MKKPRDISDDLRAQFEKMKPAPDQIYTIHNNIRKMTRQFDEPGPAMQETLDFEVPNGDAPVSVRFYKPYGASSTPGPTLIYLHGGGFVTGSIKSHEGICLRVASGSTYRVLSVRYRLAPQHPFPAATDDCEAVLKWALDGHGLEHGINPDKIALGGDSAGGNMTAYLTQKHRDKIKAQILYYPLMQLVEMKPAKPGPQDVFQLGLMALKFIDEHYVRDADTNDTKLSPLFERNLRGIPPTQLVTCGLDPLRMEGRAYADNLRAAGVLVKESHEKAMPHGFLNFSRAFPRAKKVPLDTADFLREHMNEGKYYD